MEPTNVLDTEKEDKIRTSKNSLVPYCGHNNVTRIKNPTCQMYTSKYIDIPTTNNISGNIGNNVSVENPSQFTCAKCLWHFSKWNLLIKHVFSHEQCVNSPIHVCLQFGQVFLKPSKLVDHNFHHNEKTTLNKSSLFELTCVFCVQTFESWYHLTKHVFNHISTISAPLYVCKYCPEVFKDIVKLSLHKNANISLPKSVYCNHQSYIVSNGQYHPTLQLRNNIKEEPLTRYSFKNRLKYDQNYKIFHSYEGSSVLRKSYTLSPCLKKNKGIFPCKSPFSCDVCGKTFTAPANLKLTHSSKHNLTCKVCGKSFIDSRYLKQHQKIHSAIRRFCCEVCGRCFTYSGDLNRHQRVHSGECPFVCDVCGRGFSQSGNLKTHERIHSAIRPFCCEICGRGFTSSFNLDKHQRIHSGERPFCCEICGKGFIDSGDRNKHQRYHIGERPFSCQICGKLFTESGNLKQHLIIHSDERPFSCQVCGKSFANAIYLKKHLKRH